MISSATSLNRNLFLVSFLTLSCTTTFFAVASAFSVSSTTTMKSAATSRGVLTQSDYRARLLDGSKITSKDVSTLPRPGTSVPGSIQFHDNHWVTYLLAPDATQLSRQLLATNLQTSETIQLFQPGNSGTEDDFSLEEKLRRERARTMATGVTSYSWAAGKVTKRMLVPLGGALWLLDDPLGSGNSNAEPIKLVETNTEAIDETDFDALPTNAPLLDAKISADGSTIAFVCGNEVYVLDVATGIAGETTKPRRITDGARGVDGCSNGVADYVAQEELERADGFWLSPKGTFVAFENVDESHIPSYRITHQGEQKGLSPTLDSGMTSVDVAAASTITYEEHRYPFAGAENPRVKLGVVNKIGGGGTKKDVKWFDLASVFGEEFYLAKVEWLPGASGESESDNLEESTRFVVQLLDRRQQSVALVMCDCVAGTMTTLHMEKAMEGTWINLNNSFRLLASPDNSSSLRFLWASERDGYRHLYVLEASLENAGTKNINGAKVLQRLTGPGEFITEEVVEVDKETKCVYYMGTAPDQWLERHLFRVSLNDSESKVAPECLTGAIPGQHSCVVNAKAGLFVDTVSSVSQAPTVTIRKLSDPTEIQLPLYDAATADPRLAALGDALKPPTFHRFPSTDGKVTLQGALYLPDEETHGKGPWPLLVATYGGPHVQYVQNTFGMMTADMRSQFLRANGFAVLKVDNRGSNRRGLLFEAPIFGNMGELEVEDQVAGVKWAVRDGYADEKRVAVSGWSYGGYMSLKCLTGRPDVFHAAVSGAPVTDWTLYDTAYTERYMGLPQENPEGYTKASALTKIKDMEGSLLLCHGLLDENVLFRQSAVLVNALIEHQKAYDLLLFPSERHGPRRPQDRAFLEERILAFLQRSLGV